MSKRSERSISGLTAMILAGGLGTRLRSVVPDTPKVLAEVNQRPFLTFLLRQLEQSGVQRVILCTGHCAEVVESELRSWCGGLQLDFSVEHAPLGTAGALRNALSRVETDNVLVLNGDSFCEIDIDAFYSNFISTAALASIALVAMEDASRYGTVKLQGDRIAEFQEKCEGGESGWINAGLYCMRKELIATWPAGSELSLERDIFPSLIGQNLLAYRVESGVFIDIGTPSSFAAAQEVLQPVSVELFEGASS